MKRLLLLLPFFLPACASYDEPRTGLGTELREAVYDFKHINPDGSLSAEEANDFDRFLHGLPLAGISRAAFETNDGNMLGSSGLSEAMTLARDSGIPDGRLVVMPVADEQPVALRVRLNIRMWKLPEKCPYWGSTGTFNQTQSLDRHLGCATAGNFMLQVADPADLVRGTGSGRAVPESAIQAVGNYMAPAQQNAAPTTPSSVGTTAATVNALAESGTQ